MNTQNSQEQMRLFLLRAREGRAHFWPQSMINLTANEIGWKIGDSVQRTRPLGDIQTISLFLVGLPRGGERFTCVLDFGDIVIAISCFADYGQRQQMDSYREFVKLLHQHILAQRQSKISYRTGSAHNLLKLVVAVSSPILSCIFLVLAFKSSNFGSLCAAVAVAVGGGLIYQNLAADKPASYLPEAIPAHLLP